MLADDFPALLPLPPREETGKEDKKTTCLFSGGSLNTISRGGGHHLAGFLRCSRFEERWGRGLEVVLPLELPRLWVYGCQWLGQSFHQNRYMCESEIQEDISLLSVTATEYPR